MMNLKRSSAHPQWNRIRNVSNAWTTLVKPTLTRSFVIFITVLVTLLLPACRRNPEASALRATPTVDESPLSSVASEIQRRGYRVVQRPISSPTAWETATFRTRDRHVVSFKANDPLPNTSDYYLRFLLIEETFDTQEDAEQRLRDLHRKVPDRFDNEYELTLREGFRIGETTYIVQTDASIFWDELRRL